MNRADARMPLTRPGGGVCLGGQAEGNVGLKRTSLH